MKVNYSEGPVGDSGRPLSGPGICLKGSSVFTMRPNNIEVSHFDGLNV